MAKIDRIALVALFQELSEKGESPASILAEMFVPILYPMRGQVLNKQKFIDDAQQIFGSDFDELVANVMWSLLADKNYLVRKRYGENLVYSVIDDITLSDTDRTQGLMADFAAIFDGFWEFIELKEPLLAGSYEKEEWQKDLFSWLTSADKNSYHQADRLADQLVKAPIADIERNLEGQDSQQENDFDRARLYRFAQFIKHTKTSSPELLEKVASFAGVGFVFRAVRGLNSAPKLDSTNIDLTVVLDGPVVLDAVGLSGLDRENSTQNLLTAGRKLGLHFATLSHCLEEAAEIVKSVLNENRAYGLTSQALRKDPKLVSVARKFVNRPDQFAKNAGLTIPHFDIEQNPIQHKYFEKELFEEFRDRAHFGSTAASVIRRERDALSFTFIARRRGNQHSSNLLDSRFALITRNNNFVSFAERFTRQYMPSIPRYSSAHVVEQSVLAAILWLTTANNNAGDLPKEQLFATCDRLLANNRKVIERAEKRALSMTEEDREQLELLMQDPTAVEELMVLDARSPIDTSDAEELLSAVKNAVSEEVRFEELKERKKQQRKHLMETKKIKSELIETKTAYASSEDERNRLSINIRQILTLKAELYFKRKIFLEKVYDYIIWISSGLSLFGLLLRLWFKGVPALTSPIFLGTATILLLLLFLAESKLTKTKAQNMVLRFWFRRYQNFLEADLPDKNAKQRLKKRLEKSKQM